MSSGAFLLAFSLGAAAIALWIFVCLPKLGPTNMNRAFAHVAAAMVVGVLLKQTLTLMAGLDFPLAVFTALFGVALPGLTYMFVAGAWLLRAMSAGLSR
jgi:hypothetical protein